MYKLRTAGYENMRTLGAAVSRETGVFTPPDAVSRTVQSEKDNADINVIVRRFGITGQMPANVRLPSYGDYTGVSDFQSAMNVIRQAEESFMAMPADVRARFGNSPQAFLEFATNQDNLDELRKMGLAIPKPEGDNPPAPEITPARNRSKPNERSPRVRAGKAPEASGKSDRDGNGE